MIYGRNWTPKMTSEITSAAGKRDHSSMATAPQLPSPKGLTTRGHSNPKRWKQQKITAFTTDNTDDPSRIHIPT